MNMIFSLLRIKQYIKNIFIFLPLFFSLNFIYLDKVIISIFTFIVFSLIASSIYIINDILDLEQDKQHPKKCLRPIAAGKITPQKALTLSIILSIIGFGLSLFLNKFLFLYYCSIT